MASDLEAVELDLPPPVIPVPNPIPCDPLGLSLDFLGGYQMRPYVGPDRPLTDCNEIESLIQQLLAALAAVGPVFLISDTLIAILDCIKAIPEAITTLNPFTITDCLQNLVAKIIALVCALYPPFAFPAMIASIVQFLIQALSCVATVLQAICDAQDRLANLKELVRVNPEQEELEDVLEAAEFNLECREVHVASTLEAILFLIDFINGLIQIANDLSPQGDLMPTIPVPTIEPDNTCGQKVEVVENLLTVLKDFAAVIPDCGPNNPPV